MVKKVQIPVMGGLRKVVQVTNPATQAANPGTTITEFANQTVSLAQLKTALGIKAATGNSGGGGVSAAINLGPGLSGGGVVAGAVPINLTAPIPAFVFGDDGGGGGDGEPGPPGVAGRDGTTGAPGPPGPAVMFLADEPEIAFDAIPGARGPTGPTGSPGPIGPAAFMSAEDGEDGWHAIPGAKGADGAQGPQGLPGPAIFMLADDGNDGEPGPPGVSAAGGGSGNTNYAGNGIPSTLHNDGDLYFDISQVPPLAYVQETIALPPVIENATIVNTWSATATTTFALPGSASAKLMLVLIAHENATQQTISSITGGSLTFTKHSSVNTNNVNGRWVTIEVWSAPISGAFASTTFTITANAAIDDGSVYAAVLDGVSVATPFDTSADKSAAQPASATPLAVTSVATSNANDLLFCLVASNQTGPPAWTVPAGFTLLTNVYNHGAVQFSELQVNYQKRTSTLASSAITTGVSTAIPAVALTFAVQGVAVSQQWVQYTLPSAALTFATLPAAPAVGYRAFITDCTTASFGSAAAGGGVTAVPVYWNGTQWNIG